MYASIHIYTYIHAIYIKNLAISIIIYIFLNYFKIPSFFLWLGIN